MTKRIETLGEYPIVVYCSSCRSAFMQAGRDAWHILDLMWGPVVCAGDVPPKDVLEIPENAWHNRFQTRIQILKYYEV